MSTVILYFIVLLIGATPFLEATLIIPISVLAGLNVWSVTILSLIGNLITFLAAVILAEQLKRWWGERRKSREKKKNKSEKAAKLWTKYGLPGLAIIHQFTIGSSHATAFIALSLGASKKAVTLWIGGSVVVWAIVFAVLSFFGADFIYSQIDSDGFLNDLFNLNQG